MLLTWSCRATLRALALLALLSQGAGASKASDFMQWLSKNGAKLDGVAVRKVKGMGYGVVATRDLPEKHLALSVPSRLALSRETMERDEMVDQLKRFPAIDDAMVAWLLVHRQLGDRSFFAPYLAMLPKSVPVCHFFSDDELGMLQTPSHERLCKEARRREEGSFANFAGPFRTLCNEYSTEHPDTPLSGDVTLQDYMWGKTMLWSRAWTVSGRRYLVPFADMFNYDPLPESRKAESGANFLQYHSVGTAAHSGEFLQMWTDRAVGKGDQVFEDYGDNRNLIYLLNHGFVPRTNPFNAVPVPLVGFDPAAASDVARLRRSLAVEAGAAPTFEVYADAATMPDAHADKAAAAAAVRAASDADVQRCADKLAQSSVGKMGARWVLDCLGDARSPAELVAALVPDVRAALEAYDTTLQEDEALLAEHSPSSHAALAIRYRMALKQTLRSFVDHTTTAAPVTARAPPPASALLKGLVASFPEQSTQELVDQFNAWVRRRASEFPTNFLAAAPIPGMRIGAVATRRIPKDSLYISVMPSVLMSEENAWKDAELREVLADLTKRFGSSDNFHSLLLHLLCEAKKGLGSEWWEYIAILPRDLSHNPVMFDADTLAMLEGSALLPRIQSRIGTIRSKFEKVNELIFGHYPLLSWVTYEDYLWAHLILDSRSIWWDGQRHLVPVLDLINCRELAPEMRVHSTTAHASTKAAETRAPWDFNEGDEVFENYGQPSHTYFLYHGFVLSPNSHDCVLLDVGSVLDQPGSFECVAVGNVPQRLLGALGAKFGAKSPREVLADLASDRLGQYSTGIAADEALLASGKLPGAQESVVRLRLGEKRLLAALVEEFARAPQRKDEL